MIFWHFKSAQQNEILIQAQWKQSLAVESMIWSIYQLYFSCKLKPADKRTFIGTLNYITNCCN